MDLRAVLEGANPALPPQADWIRRPSRPVAHLGLLPGSFNPPTLAHVGLARSGRAAGLDAVAYVLAARTVDKEVVTGIPLLDRLDLLRRLAADSDDGVLLLNRGLYVEIARAVTRVTSARLTFLVGFDKIVQILDPRYYDDRDAALRDLFRLARILVAPRADTTFTDIDDLMARPENTPYREFVGPLDLEPGLRALSSTRVRRGAAAETPPIVRDYLRAHPIFPQG